jgi:hypothetical protein
MQPRQMRETLKPVRMNRYIQSYIATMLAQFLLRERRSEAATVNCA